MNITQDSVSKRDNAPLLDAATARTILDTLDELDCGLSQRQIDLKRTAKAALAYWAAQEGRAA